MNLDVILRERLAILGGTGSGKSYAARGLAERILAHGDRLGVIDPTGVWWGLRSDFPVVLFGGDHADLPLTEHAGRVVAQAVATSQQSWIIDTSALQTKAAERRFMLDFLDGLFGANRAPITLIVDEADRFSPQRMSPETTRLHERMEEIVRRGRVRGFTPWLITQRPASLNKDVLSQATSLICMRMTGAQDRSAIGDVIEGQADKTTAKAIVDAMPRHKVGEGMVWAPTQGILLPVKFPTIKTFDSMSADTAHKHADRKLPPIDVDSLKEKLASVEVETKANDPAALKKRIRELEAEVARKPAPAGAPITVINAKTEQIEAARKRGWDARGREDHELIKAALTSTRITERRLGSIIAEAAEIRTPLRDLIAKIEAAPELPPDHAPAVNYVAASAITAIDHASRPGILHRKPKVLPLATQRQPPADGLTGPMQRILDALAWWLTISVDRPSRVQVAAVARYNPNGGSFNNPLGALRSAGLVDYPGAGLVTMTESGLAKSRGPDARPTTAELHERVLGILSRPQRRILEPLLASYPTAMTREDLAAASNYDANGGSFNNPVGSLRSLGLIDYPQRGHVVALPILFVE